MLKKTFFTVDLASECYFSVPEEYTMNNFTRVILLLLLLLLHLNIAVVKTENGTQIPYSIVGENRYDLAIKQSHTKNVTSIRPSDDGASLLQTELNDEICFKINIWFVWDNQSQSCHCGSDLYGAVLCDTDTKELAVLDNYCLTSQGKDFSVAGICFFNPANFTDSGVNGIMYCSAPSDCGSLNRQGTLCGQCLDGYTVPAYSYDLKCIRCDSQLENWGLYIVFAFLPLTVFIVITLVFRINVLSPELNMFVFAAQFISTPICAKYVLHYLSQRHSPILIPTKIILTLYGMWNLDFLRFNILPDICVNEIPHYILILDYLVAIYPMLLIATAYIIIQLHDSGFRPLRYMWKPFHRFFARFRRQWGIQTTLMDAFVTFFFLSTTKLFSVSISLLSYTLLYKSDGKQYSLNLYYDPNIKYFGREHLPYALLALGILIVFIVFPTSLLLCYQCKVYQKCLTKCHIRGATLDEFVDTFQKYYKDGSNGSWDCRWFAGFFILYKSSMYLVYAISKSNNILFILVLLLAIIGVVVVVIVEPYKEEYSVFNTIFAIFFLWVALLAVSVSKESLYIVLQVAVSDHYISSVILALIPLVYIIGVAVYHCIRRFRGQKEDDLTSSLPDRLLHSDQYRDNSLSFIAAS